MKIIFGHKRKIIENQNVIVGTASCLSIYYNKIGELAQFNEFGPGQRYPKPLKRKEFTLVKLNVDG